jgi:hypothetical protein
LIAGSLPWSSAGDPDSSSARLLPRSAAKILECLCRGLRGLPAKGVVTIRMAGVFAHLLKKLAFLAILTRLAKMFLTFENF